MRFEGSEILASKRKYTRKFAEKKRECQPVNIGKWRTMQIELPDGECSLVKPPNERE